MRSQRQRSPNPRLAAGPSLGFHSNGAACPAVPAYLAQLPLGVTLPPLDPGSLNSIALKSLWVGMQLLAAHRRSCGQPSSHQTSRRDTAGRTKKIGHDGETKSDGHRVRRTHHPQVAPPPPPPLVGTLEEGAFLGQTALTRQPVLAGAYALDEVTVLQIDRAHMEELVLRKPLLLQEIGRAIEDGRANVLRVLAMAGD